jgi:hypothetical protein
MPVGNLSTVLRDGALGIIPSLPTGLQVSFGTCSLGTPATAYYLSTIDDVSAQLGAGPSLRRWPTSSASREARSLPSP